MGGIRAGIVVLLLLLQAACTESAKEELILFDFESDSVLDEIHWQCHTLFFLSELYPAHGNQSLKLELYPSAYPGLSPALKYHDWSRYRFFCFDVYNTSPDRVNLTVRIDDTKNSLDYDDRVNKTFALEPGSNHLVMPMDNLITSGTRRQLDLKRIYRFLTFVVHPQEKIVLYFDYFRLIP